MSMLFGEETRLYKTNVKRHRVTHTGSRTLDFGKQIATTQTNIVELASVFSKGNLSHYGKFDLNRGEGE